MNPHPAQDREKDLDEVLRGRTPGNVRPPVDCYPRRPIRQGKRKEERLQDERSRPCGSDVESVVAGSNLAWPEDQLSRAEEVPIHLPLADGGQRTDSRQVLGLETRSPAAGSDAINRYWFPAHRRQSESSSEDLSTTLTITSINIQHMLHHIPNLMYDKYTATLTTA
jgi:hypothetical protein